MRGGKRENAGRKGTGKTKTIRIPIEIEPSVMKLIAEYKTNLNALPEEKSIFDSVTKSKQSIKPMFTILTKEQIKRFQDWLIDNNFAKTRTEARKKSSTPKLCKRTFLEHIHWTDNWQNENITDICELYTVDE